MSANDVKFVGNDEDGLIGVGWNGIVVRVIARGDDRARTEAWITPLEARILAEHLTACAYWAESELDGETDVL